MIFLLSFFLHVFFLNMFVIVVAVFDDCFLTYIYFLFVCLFICFGVRVFAEVKVKQKSEYICTR